MAPHKTVSFDLTSAMEALGREAGTKSAPVSPPCPVRSTDTPAPTRAKERHTRRGSPDGGKPKPSPLGQGWRYDGPAKGGTGSPGPSIVPLWVDPNELKIDLEESRRHRLRRSRSLELGHLSPNEAKRLVRAERSQRLHVLLSEIATSSGNKSL